MFTLGLSFSVENHRYECFLRTVTLHPYLDNELYKLAQEVMELIRSVVDKQSFAEAFATMQKKVVQTRESRKRKIATEVIFDIC